MIITSEIPIESFDNPKHEGQWRRWNLAKSIYNLKGETWSSEPLPNEVTCALELLGFNVYAEKTFPKSRSFKYQEGMDEWKAKMLNEVEELPWTTHLKNALRKVVNETYDKVMKDGFLMNPARYVLKCEKEIDER